MKGGVHSIQSDFAAMCRCPYSAQPRPLARECDLWAQMPSHGAADHPHCYRAFTQCSLLPDAICSDCAVRLTLRVRVDRVSRRRNMCDPLVVAYLPPRPRAPILAAPPFTRFPNAPLAVLRLGKCHICCWRPLLYCHPPPGGRPVLSATPTFNG